MKIHSEKSLFDFEFWSGASDFAAKLTRSEMETIEGILEDLYPEGIDETALNDLFWHDSETVADWIGEDIEDIYNRED